ncbi:TonB-dependent receptor [Candidatus Litorirhabdus singularis]|nr:TonB-dependent receptor [Candidatus Litorirhabdus singularis]
MRSSIVLAMSLAAVAVVAQEDEQEQPAEQRQGRMLEEIVVTVERREQSLQDYAGTAFAISGDDLKLQGIQNLADLSESTPGLQINNKQGNFEVWIRGIGSSNNTELGDPAAATHYDGVYLPRPTGIGSAFYDIARVEVNMGPQGTLRGRNATAGSVNIVPWRPGIGVFDAMIEVEGGNYNSKMVTGMVNLPVGDNSAFRIAAYGMEHDAYYNDVGPLSQDIAEAAENSSARLQYLWEPNDKASLLLAFDYLDEKGSGYTGTNYANPLGNGIDPEDIKDPRDVHARGLEPRNDTEHWGAKLEFKYDLGFAQLEYTGSFRSLDYNFEASTPLTPDYQGVTETLGPLDEAYDNWSRFQFLTESESTIHELRLISPTEERLYYTVGLFYFKENQKSFLASAGDRGTFFQGAEFNQPDVVGESISAYGDMTFEINERMRISAGLRYTYDEKSRQGVNGRYAFALGGFDVTTGNEFACCMGARVGTEGFEFAGFDRQIYDPDLDGSGDVSGDEFLEFYNDGIKSYGARDTLDDILANGIQPGGSATPAQCTDTITTDGLICPADGNHSFVDVINPSTSITVQDGEMDADFVDWRLRLAYDVGESSMAYGLVSTGHKSGGFNDTFSDPEVGIDISPTYDTETVTLYELGWKSEFDLGSVPTRFNASAFYYDYADQVFTSLLSVEQALDFDSGVPPDPDAIDQSGALVVSFSYNAADSEIYGMQFDGGFDLPYNFSFDYTALWLEAEIIEAEPIQDFRFQADVAPDDAVFRSIDGKRLPHTPKYQLNMKLSQWFAVPWGTVDYVVSAGWRDEQYLTIFNGEDYGQPEDPRQRLDDRVPAYWTFDVGMGYSHGDGNLRIEAFANNSTEEVKNAAVIITQFDNTRFYTRPRTYGARVKYFF